MKKRKVTYGVYNLVEWQARLRVGKGWIEVPFTGGSTTTSGVTPASFTTSDPVVQFAIEKSEPYRRGKIKTVRSIDLGGSVAVGRRLQAGGVSERPEASGGVERPQAGDTGNKAEKPAVIDLEPAGVGLEPAGTDLDSAGSAPVEMEFACNDDARDFLMDRFGFNRSKIRTRDEIVKAGLSMGVTISFE